MFNRRVVASVAQALRGNPSVWSAAKQIHVAQWQLRHILGSHYPSSIRPNPRQLTIAVTADCNLRCIGCRYGRDFMPGARLRCDVVRQVLEDAADANIERVRFYGGEPLLHPDLPEMVLHAARLGLSPYVTTNGTHLGRKAEALYEAGLRLVTIGFYGVGAAYDSYTQRRDHFRRLEESLTTVRDRLGGKLQLQLNFVLMNHTCTVESFREAWAFAERFDMLFHLDLAGRNIPFFSPGADDSLLLTEGDRPRVEDVCRAMLALKNEHPSRFLHSAEFLRSVPDWLILGPQMRVPCTAYELLWIGADGTLQLCDTAFPLGNVNERRLRELIFGKEHRQAARDAFQLKCPNCTCMVETRVQRDRAAFQRYRGSLSGQAVP